MSYDDIDSDVRAFIDKVESLFPDDSADADVAEQRRRYTNLCNAFDRDRPAGVTVRDDAIEARSGAVPIRVYRPASSEGGCLIYYHGGGWVVGDLDSHDGVCAEIADRAGMTVIAADYRLAPEHPCPAAHEDSWDVLATVAGEPERFGIDAARIGIGGDSAGANISAGLAMRARERGGPTIAAQILVYGAYGGDWSLPSYTEHANAPMLSTADMRAYHQLYCGNDDLPPEPFLSPLKADDFSNLPPAFVQPVGLDPLRDDSVELARALESAGVPVTLSLEEGLPHGALRARHTTERGRVAFAHLCDAVKRMLA